MNLRDHLTLAWDEMKAHRFRAFLTSLGVIMGVGSVLAMIAIVASPDGKTLCKAKLTGDISEAKKLGERLAEELLKQGANKILAAS